MIMQVLSLGPSVDYLTPQHQYIWYCAREVWNERPTNADLIMMTLILFTTVSILIEILGRERLN